MAVLCFASCNEAGDPSPKSDAPLAPWVGGVFLAGLANLPSMYLFLERKDEGMHLSRERSDLCSGKLSFHAHPPSLQTYA